VVPRQDRVLAAAVFRIVPKVDIKLLSEFWVQTSLSCGDCGYRPFDHVLVIT
jgi:hypothetical protein